MSDCNVLVDFPIPKRVGEVSVSTYYRPYGPSWGVWFKRRGCQSFHDLELIATFERYDEAVECGRTWCARTGAEFVDIHGREGGAA